MEAHLRARVAHALEDCADRVLRRRHRRDRRHAHLLGRVVRHNTKELGRDRVAWLRGVLEAKEALDGPRAHEGVTVAAAREHRRLESLEQLVAHLRLLVHLVHDAARKLHSAEAHGLLLVADEAEKPHAKFLDKNLVDVCIAAVLRGEAHDELNHTLRSRLSLVHGQHTGDAAEVLVVPGVDVRRRGPRRQKRLDALAVLCERDLRLVEDRCDGRRHGVL